MATALKTLKYPMLYALVAAVLFGAATPASKVLLSSLTSFQLAGLLYLGAALGVSSAAFRGGGIRLPKRTDTRNLLRLCGAVVAGGICGPVLLLFGLRLAEATSVSLWLNFEMAATALLGVFVFRDHLGLQGWAGVACTFAGAVLLSLGGGAVGFMAGAFVLLACLCWGLDNHLTALIDAITPAESTFWKGLVAGVVNLAIGFALAPRVPAISVVVMALIVGAFAYGASIVLYIMSAHALGSTRAQIVFSSAPFFGVALSALLLEESLTLVHLGSGLLFVAGIGFLYLERHAHLHEHTAMEHEHEHLHDDSHHDHDHPRLVDSTRHVHRHRHAAIMHDHPRLVDSTRHVHRHRHAAIMHDHPHLPDLHHRHQHGGSPD